MQRVQELRQEKIEAERLQQLAREKQIELEKQHKIEMQKHIVEWEAQSIFALEELRNSILCEQFPFMDIYDCMVEIIYHNNYNLFPTMYNLGIRARSRHIYDEKIQKPKIKQYLKNIDIKSTEITQEIIHLRCLIDFVNEIKVQEIRKLEEEQRLLKEKALIEQREQNKIMIKNMNAANKKNVAGHINTFQEVNIDELYNNKTTEKHNYLILNGENWHVRRPINAHWSNNSYYEILQITDPPASWASYFEEGKVPFCTKCPICQKQTKFNLITSWHGVGGGHTNTNEFKEIYCKDHYFYHTPTKKHYIINPKGQTINICHDRFISTRSMNQSADYTPTGNWSEWDPADPDGSKAEEERKRKVKESIQRQIAELQSKLQAV